MLPWYMMFGAIGNQPGELITYQPTWHHGHAVMRFLPDMRKGPPAGEIPPAFKFTQGSFEFYKHPHPSAYSLNRILYELRLSSDLRRRFFKNPEGVAKEFGCNDKEAVLMRTVLDENIDALRSMKRTRWSTPARMHLGMLMSLVVVQAEMRRLTCIGRVGTRLVVIAITKPTGAPSGCPRFVLPQSLYARFRGIPQLKNGFAWLASAKTAF